MKFSWQMPAPLRGSLAHYLPQNSNTHDPYKDNDDDNVGLLEDEKEALHTTANRPLLNTRTKWTYLAIGVGVVFLVLVAVAYPSRTILGADDAPPVPENDTREHRYLHTVLPTSIVTLDLCKAVLSSTILGYPAPWVIGWEKDLTDAQRKAHEAALPKLKTVEQWLNALPQARNTDIIAFLGNPNALFQARPEVLLRRYFRKRATADERLAQTFTHDLVQNQRMHTKVVFSTEKECPSTQPDGVGCKEVSAEDGSIHYLSSNLIMGQAGMMRALWNTAVKRAEQHTEQNETFDENSIFSEIFRDQEAHREAVRGRNEASNQTGPIGNKRKEFGITLDFARELSYTTDSHLDHVDWVIHEGNKAAPLSKDIGVSMQPFWTTANAGLPSNNTWADVPLLTDVRDNTIPAIIHQGPEASEELRESWWQKLWFQPYARLLLDSIALTPVMPFAMLRNASVATRWWSPHWQTAGVMTPDKKFHAWGQFCGSEEEAKLLFMDEKGLWKDPRSTSTHYFPQDS